jgi:cytochrome c-type biogenesis protein CcmF
MFPAVIGASSPSWASANATNAALGVAPIGHTALLSALVLAVYGLVAIVAGGRFRLPGFLASARNAMYATAAFLTLASMALVYAFVTHDFSIKYVADTSNRDAPLIVTLTGFWGGQAGSLLFWAWGLGLLGALAVRLEFARHPSLLPGMLATLLGVEVFLVGVLGFVSNPFATTDLVPSDGRGLNPLLWDIGMRVHPPLLLLGYMSFTVPFAIAIGALVSGRLGKEWLAPVRRWMLVAWAVQGAGLLAGAWWAYHVLGWGGYWGWDPVENVALLPWLTATAFLHSILVQERRGMLKLWNLSLVIASFSLALFGTFVVRSGVLTSVHSFAQSTVGGHFLAFFTASLLVPLALLYWRLPSLRAEGTFDSIASREAAFLVNNLLLVAIAAVTFWGTVFPLVAELARGEKVSVGAPFYEQVNGPLLLALVVLMGIGPLLAWRYTSNASLWRSLRWPLAAAGLTSAVLLGLGMRQGLAVLAMAATAFTLVATGLEFARGVTARQRSTAESFHVALVQLVKRARRRYGGYVVHLGMLFIAIGVIASTFHQTEDVGTLAPGESLAAGRYQITYSGLDDRLTPAVRTVFARLEVRDASSGQRRTELEPERRVYRGWEDQPVTGVAYRTVGPWLDDIYVMLTEWDETERATFRVFVNPLVVLIWLGGAIFIAGTLIAGWPPMPPVQKAAPVTPRPARQLAQASGTVVTGVVLALVMSIWPSTATASPGAGYEAAPQSQRDIDQNAREIGRRLKCPVCENMSVADSPSPLAEQMRATIREQLLDGWSRAEILGYYVERYGQEVLLEPAREGFVGLVWWGAIAVPITGALLVARLLRQWVTRRPVAPSMRGLTAAERRRYGQVLAQELAAGEDDQSSPEFLLAAVEHRDPATNGVVR